MGKMVNGKWNELAVDDYGVAAPQAPKPAAAPAPTAPAPQYNTNTYEQRQALRDAGYFIDNSGVYAPGSGQRVQDTWSGDLAHQNVAPQGPQLPVLNGTPVSPSNGFTGPQTNAIMYRGDPLYAQYFGQGTPGYQATSRAANATPGALPQGQGQYQLHPIAPIPAPVSQPTAPAPQAPQQQQPMALLTGQVAETSQQSAQRNQENSYLTEFSKPSADGLGYGPYSTSAPPQLTIQGRYVDGGKLIEKSTDQYGHEYFQTVGDAAGAPAAPAAVQGAPAPQAPASAPAQAPQTQGQPGAAPTPANATPRTFMGADGKAYNLNLTDQDYQNVLADQQAAAAAEKQAREFAQGIEQGKLDVSRAVAEYQKAYQESLIQQQDRQLAATTAYQAMQIDLQKQAQELQRQAQGQTVAMEREKLALAKRQARGSRRLPGVRIR